MPDRAEWQLAEVVSPHLVDPVPVIAAKDIPYIHDANRLQNLSIYVPLTAETADLAGRPVERLPGTGSASLLPRYYVHVHGGAWRDPGLTAASVEPTVAHAFSAVGASAPISAIASINYTVTQFDYPAPPMMARPPAPYDAIKDNHTDPAREAVHPQHVSDVLHGLALLSSLGLTDQSYILSGHSCGACLAFQAILQPPRHYGLGYLPEAPCPAAMLGLDGLYDLPALVDGLGADHERLRGDYETMLSRAFGADQRTWPAASPAHFDPADIAGRVRNGKAPRLIVLDQSTEDHYLTAHGLQKIFPRMGFGGIQGTVDGFARDGMRGGRVPAMLAATMQFGTGVLLTIGLITPLAAMGAAGVMIVATESRFRTGFWSQRGGFEYPAFLSVACLAFIWSGGGRYSVDAVVALHSPAWGLALCATVISVVAASLTVTVLRGPDVRQGDHSASRPA